MADIHPAGPAPASGGQGVARDADLGRPNSRGAVTDVFEQATHVVKGPICDLDNGGINSYFGSDAFGHTAAMRCR